MTLLDNYLAEVKRDVDGTLDALVPGPDVEPARLHEAIRWSLFPGGKRIRPVIVYAAGEVFGATRENLTNTAAAIEMIHTFSLIHDDLPAMDDDDLRRGRAACHTQFGEATAILAGDVLQTLAFKAIADDLSLSAEMRVLLITLLADTSGTPKGMVAGQQLDLDAEGRTVTLDEIETIHARKTGALISAAATSGAMIGGATIEQLDSIARYAYMLGLLFQITDDILDVTQETAVLGKTAGKDAAANKATYPALLGLDGARDAALKVYREACDALADIDGRIRLLEAIAGRVLSRVQ